MNLDIKLETCKCGKDRIASENYCGKCGFKYQTQMRSANEIGAMLKKLETISPKNLGEIAMLLVAVATLRWAQGSDLEPYEILKGRPEAH